MTEHRFTVTELPGESRYVLRDPENAAAEIGEESYVDVVAEQGAEQVTERVLYHTGVSESYGGQGLASVLVQYVVDDIVARGYHIVPVCPYVKKWLPKHPAYAEYVAAVRPEHLRAISSR